MQIHLHTHVLNAISNGMCLQEHLDEVKSSCYQDDFNFDHLQRHLSLLVDLIKQEIPMIKKVMSIVQYVKL